MQNIENLSSEERKLLCDIIGGKELKNISRNTII